MVKNAVTFVKTAPWAYVSALKTQDRTLPPVPEETQPLQRGCAEQKLSHRAAPGWRCLEWGGWGPGKVKDPTWVIPGSSREALQACGTPDVCPSLRLLRHHPEPVSSPGEWACWHPRQLPRPGLRAVQPLCPVLEAELWFTQTKPCISVFWKQRQGRHAMARHTSARSPWAPRSSVPSLRSPLPSGSKVPPSTPQQPLPAGAGFLIPAEAPPGSACHPHGLSWSWR